MNSMFPESDGRYFEAASMTLAREQEFYQLKLEQAADVCLVDGKHALMTQDYFNQLLEYTGTLPTGTYFGKRWKTRCGGDWQLGEYFDSGDPDMVGIRWREILVQP